MLIFIHLGTVPNAKLLKTSKTTHKSICSGYSLNLSVSNSQNIILEQKKGDQITKK